MEHLGTVLEKARESTELQEKDTRNTQVTLNDDDRGKQQVTEMVAHSFNALNVYGKTPEQVKGITKSFLFILSEYPVAKIQEAFVYYLKNNSEMPTPADIANIIDRGNRPPFEKNVYNRLCFKDREHLTPSEWEYMRDYENYMIKG